MSNLTELKEIYIRSQIKVNTLIEQQIKEDTNKKVEKIISEGGANSNTFWNIRRKLINHNKNEDYTTKDENGNKIDNPEQAKEHIAEYYDNLYQAREGEESHKTWTEHIKTTVEKIEKEVTQYECKQPFTYEELDKCIKKLKTRKSTGPDNIPNEAIIKADITTREIYLTILNEIYCNESIPTEWQEGEIIRIYKGKGEKGKCSNERGITLTSNMGKLFERLINNRIKHEIETTEVQAGGQAGKSTADHISILNNIINHNKKKKKQDLHVVFLDVTKAYDKAWLKAILYTTHKNGLKGKNWKIVNKLNSNLTAKLRTKYGLTRQIQIKDSIRQGGVLSVIEYVNLMDEIAKELQAKSVGYQEIGNSTTLGCLLWMDDVVLIHHNKEEIQKMLDITDDIAKRYHIKFGKEKSQVLTIGKAARPPNLKLGDDPLDQANTYKYLGITINSKGNLEAHLNNIQAKSEAALQTIFSLAGNDEFRHIEMTSIWKLVQACLIPIMTYGAETWIPTQTEMKQAQKNMDNVIKRIIRAPITTPSEIVTAETGIWDIETQIAKKQITYYHKIRTTSDPGSQLYKNTMNSINPWRKQVEKTMQATNIDGEELLEKNHQQAKNYITSKLRKHQSMKIYRAAENKSKVRDYVCHKTTETVTKKPNYMSNLTRRACSNIFNTRARMIKIKGNYRNKYNDMSYVDGAKKTTRHKCIY